MPEPIAVAEPVVVATPVVAPVVAEPVAQVDLMSRVAAFKAPVVPDQNLENSFFDYKEIEAIQDPVAKAIAEKAYKSMQSGFTKKTQDIAEQKRQFEQKVQEMQNWSPERIQQELLNNPQFVQAAQQIAANQNPPNSGLTDEEFSALTPTEKKELASLKSEINQLKQTNHNTAIQAQITQKDAQLLSKYPDYNPSMVNEATNRLASLTLPEIREYVYKAQLHDDHVKAAYELGRSEKQTLNQEKINAVSATGITANNTNEVPVKNKGEKDQDFFVRLAQFRLSQHKQK